MIFKSTDGLLNQKLKVIAFSIILLTIGLMIIGQADWLVPRHFTQIDDIGVAESLMVRNPVFCHDRN